MTILLIGLLTLGKLYSGQPSLETAVPKLTLPEHFTYAISDWADLPFVDIQLGYENSCDEGYDFLFNRYWNGTYKAYFCESENLIHWLYDDCPKVPVTLDARPGQNQTLFAEG